MEKESVLHIERNQIVNLTARYPYREASGCYYRQSAQNNPTKQYTINIPTISYKTRTTKPTVKPTVIVSQQSTTDTNMYSTYDESLLTEVTENSSQYENDESITETITTDDDFTTMVNY